MTLPISFFSTSGPGEIRMGVGEATVTLNVRRELWFERDIDGRWLVVADRHEPPMISARRGGLPHSGSIVVRDPTVIAFIDMLASLYAEPAQYADEPVFVAPDRPQ